LPAGRRKARDRFRHGGQIGELGQRFLRGNRAMALTEPDSTAPAIPE
jgi:hypothetical protein